MLREVPEFSAFLRVFAPSILAKSNRKIRQIISQITENSTSVQRNRPLSRLASMEEKFLKR
jgi:hypothetical protein